MAPDSFSSFTPFKRNLKTPCILFAKWSQCGHCHRMAPEMQKVQTALRGKIPVYMIDAEEHSRVCEQLKITGFPTIFVLGKDRVARKYPGGPSAQNIIAFAKSKSGM
ncbi:protein disulfide isomerase [Paramecium bursaria Chlorella virus OR0704.2.2]|nr:protein disulfide isomerase [Paramecium bursaria Chlorella virus CZ-2]AGE59108.1 protein disulfide isomerase [Paramecium bursaria Chlorella virus OR0704.2.2]